MAEVYFVSLRVITVKQTLAKYFVLSAFFFAVATTHAVDAPSLRCIAVTPGGDVDISWLIPPDPNGDFVSYELFSSTDGVNFNLQTVIGVYPTTSFSHIGANPLPGTIYHYYLRAAYDAGSGLMYSAPSDTLQTMVLEVDNGTQQIAELEWNAVHTPKLPTSNNKYKIYRKEGADVWQLIDSTNYGTNSYTDDVNECLCFENISYRIEIEDQSGCTSISTWTTEYFEDKTAPAIPNLDSVSVNTISGDVTVSWEPSPSCDVDGYIIAYFDGSAWQLIDTVYGASTSSYIHTGTSSGSRAERYSVAAFDSCWSGNPFKPNTSATGSPHSTIYLEGSLDQCNRAVGLNWSGYKGWGNVENYEIWVSVDNAPFSLLTTTGKTNYTHDGLNPLSVYCYFIRGLEGNGDASSTSNQLCITMYIPQGPQEHYLRYVTVKNNAVELACYVDPNADVLFYDIMRSTDPIGPFTSIGQVEPTIGNIILFEDNDINPSAQTYYYRVDVIDFCSDVRESSNVSRTILTKGLADNENLMNHITWIPYADWNEKGSGVSKYYIYRAKGDEQIDFSTPLGVVDANTFEYVDDVNNEYYGPGKFCYYVQAVEGVGNTLGFQDISTSNKVCITITPRLFIPDAFTPNGDGLNDELRPTITFAEDAYYSFDVFTRWGEKIFSTNDVYLGWNGKTESGIAEPGIYAYRVVVLNAGGEEITHTGHITLIK